MKRLLLIMALGMFSLLCAQITSTLELTNIGTFGVSGVLTIVNNNSTPITWYFSDTGDFEILVDGMGSSVLYGPMSHSITIEPYESYVTDISNSRIYPYSPGTHTAQASILQNGNQLPMGDIQTFEVPNPTDDIHALSYELSITAINSNSITGILWVENQGTNAWHGSFPYGGFAEIWVDGVANDIFHIPGINQYDLMPGESFYQTIQHTQDEPYPDGFHYATVHLQLSGFPEVGEEQSFHVGPNPAIDETQGSAVQVLKAYPNPFRERLNISSKGLSELRLYNLRGQLIRSWNSPNEAVWDGCDSSGKTCPAGLYILQSESLKQKVLKLD